MPKAPPLEYFEVTLRCPKEVLGEVVGDLSKRGLNDVSFNLISAVATYKSNKPRDEREIKSETFLADWLADHPEFRAKDAVKHFRADGRTDGACYTALRVLVEKKLLRKLGEGRYTTLAPKHQPKGLKAKPKPKKHDVNHRDFILRTASRNHGRFSTSWMKRAFEKDGRTPGNVSPSVSQLIKKKLLKRVGDSEYVLSSKMPKKTEPKKTNGAAVETPAQGA